MFDDLPDLDDFNMSSNEKEFTNSADTIVKTGFINIYISSNMEDWYIAEFNKLAVANIGIHIFITKPEPFAPEEMEMTHIKFTKEENDKNSTLKIIPVMVRWQEFDSVTGKLKIGLHFKTDVNEDYDLQEILNLLKKYSNQ